MVQCEMCGTSTSAPKTVKIEGAELEVCSECADFGTEVQTQDSTSTSTKYSTSGDASGSGSTGSSSSGSTGSSRSGGSSGGGSRSRRSDMFDDMDELAQDYNERIRDARESRGLSQADLADELNEKASLIQKLEQGDTLPSDEVQSKLERHLDITLSGDGSTGDTEWSSDTADGEYTLGDVVERKD